MNKWQEIRQRQNESYEASVSGLMGRIANNSRDIGYLLRGEEWLQHKPDCKSTVAKIKNHPRPWQCTCGLADYLGEARATT